MKTQKQVMDEQGPKRARSVLEVFDVIQSGHTPMTKHEIQQLIKLRPEIYSCLAPYAK